MLFNRDRARAYMAESKVDALVATSPVNITYFTGYACWLDPITKSYMMSPGTGSALILPGFALWPAEGEPAAIVHPAFVVNAADLPVRDIRVFASAGFDVSLT